MTRNDRDAPRDMARTMGFAALLLAVSALLSRVLGFAREIVISTVHGATAATDAYHAAFTLPELMNYFLAGGTLSITFIPLFSSYITRGDEAGGWRLFSIVATTMGGVLLVFTVLAEVFAPHLVPLVAPGFEDPELVELTVSMTRIVLPAQLMFYVGGLINATLFARKIFWPAALAPLLYNACIIAGGLVLAPWWGIQGFSVGVVLGAFFGQVVVPVYAVRETIRYRPIIAWRDPGFVKYLWLTLPLMLGATLLTVDEWLLRVLGSMHERGAITWLNQGRKLMMVLFAVIGQAAGQAALPFLTQKFHEGKGEELGAVLTESLQRVLFLASGASLWLMTIAEPLVFTVFHHGAFTTDDAAMTSDLLVAFSFGLTAWAAQSLLVRGFYARQDTLTPMVLGTLGLALSLPIYVVLNGWLGPMGLALSTSVGITLNLTLTLAAYQWLATRRWEASSAGALGLASLAGGFTRGVALGVAGAAAGWGAQVLLAPQVSVQTFAGALVSLCVVGAAFGAGAGVLAAAIRPEELTHVLGYLRRKWTGKKREERTSS